MSAMGRRGFFGRAITAVASIPMIGRDTASMVGNAPVGWGAGAPPSAGARNSDSIATRLAKKLFYNEQQTQQFRASYRVGALDHDIACLHSVSPAMKANWQRHRDDKTRETLQAWHSRIWPDQDY